MTLIFEDSLKENQHAKYVGQRSFRSQIIGRTHTHTHAHIELTAALGSPEWS